MPLYAIDGYAGEPRPGVLAIPGGQDTSRVAAEVLRDQVGDDIWEAYQSSDIDFFQTRIDELRQKSSELWAECYPPYREGVVPKTPPYRRLAELKAQIEKVDTEISQLQAFLREILDATAEGVPTGTPFGGSATKVIGEDKSYGS